MAYGWHRARLSAPDTLAGLKPDWSVKRNGGRRNQCGGQLEHIDLSYKVALVTGSTAGIGFAVARGLHEAGAEVVINGRTRQKVNAAVSRARGHAIDLATSNSCAALIEAEPAPDIVVSNLGIFQPFDFFETDDAIWLAIGR